MYEKLLDKFSLVSIAGLSEKWTLTLKQSGLNLTLPSVSGEMVKSKAETTVLWVNGYGAINTILAYTPQ